MADEFYFKQIEYPISADRAAQCIYRDPSAEMISRFNQVNGFGPGNDLLYPGHFIVIPTLGPIGDEGMGAATYVSNRINHGQRNAPNAPAPGLFNNGFGTFMYSEMTKPKNWVTGGQFAVPVASAHVTKTLSDISSGLSDLNASYIATQTARRGSDFAKKAPRFSHGAAARTAIYRNLDDNLQKLPRMLRDLGTTAQSAQDGLGISHSDVKRVFRARGSQAQVKQIAKAIEKNNKLVKNISGGNKFLGIPIGNTAKDIGGAGLTAVSGALEIIDVRRKIETAEKETPDLAPIVSVYESSRAIGGVAMGAVAGWGTSAVIAVALGSNPVGWGIAATVAIVTIGASAAGSYFGSEMAGDYAADYMKDTHPILADDVDVVVSMSKGK